MPRHYVIIVTMMGVLSSAGHWRIAVGDDVVWPGWRGPDRDGWVHGIHPPEKWPKQLQRAWQVKVGTGYGSPVVAGDSVYQHARQDESEVIWCIDLASGRVKWHKTYSNPFKIGSGAERHGKGPKSSPAVSGGRLFTMSITGILSAWNTESGELLWRKDYRSRYGRNHPYWGTATSPLIDGNRVIVHFGNDEQGALIAFDVENGQEVWSQGSDGQSYASPILVEIDGVRQIIELNMRALVSVESESGRFLWEYDYPQVSTNQNMVTPAFDRGLVLLGGENRGIRGLQPRLRKGVWTVGERWYQDKVALNMSSAVVNQGLLFGFSHYDSGRLFCLDTQTGEILWQGPGRTGDNVAFLAMPGHIMALIDNGQLKVIAANRNHLQTVAEYRVAESSTWAPPVLLESGFLVKDHDTLSLWSR